MIQTSPIEKYNQWEVTDSSIKFNKDEGCTDVKTSCEDEEDSGDGYMENDPETSSDEEGDKLPMHELDYTGGFSSSF